MNETRVVVDDRPLRLRSLHTIIVGSGAAGLNAAVWLHRLGLRDLAIVTEAWGGGASANAGSDKQTYYKLSLAGAEPDSPRHLAEDLFAGGSMHGDLALAEAQHSAQAFYHLVQLGVPFPHDAYGGYPGYRTDHDRRGRATSAGPLTSRLMVEHLSAEVRARGIPVLDRIQVVALLVDRAAGCSVGAIALDLDALDDRARRFLLFNTVNLVLATGGPGGLYADSVYPPEQTGSIGLAFAAGATGQNLTESQYGLASTAFRWNVSGSYQQVVPRYVSAAADGRDEREFLNDDFPDMATLGTAIFRKGYQWPFDPGRVRGHGSSLIDLLVHRERSERGRRVFLDYTRNPEGNRRVGMFNLDLLAAEAREYLRRSGAAADTPFERLAQLNPPAVEVYARHGIDLSRDRLEVAVCAQHNNGGLKGNHWWESNVTGLFPVGEVNGSHGVNRPGGAALNAGQVGALRAAMYIAKRRSGGPRPDDVFLAITRPEIARVVEQAERATAGSAGGRPTAADVRREIQARMSACAAHVRRAEAVDAAAGAAWALCRELPGRSWCRHPSELPDMFRNLDLALASAVYLEAIREYIRQGGASRGSYLVVDPGGDRACDTLPDDWRFRLSDGQGFVDHHVLEVTLDDQHRVQKAWVEVRPIPEPDQWFESVWQAYREDRIVG